MSSKKQRFNARASWRCSTFIALVIVATSARAADTDLVVLESGNQMTGQVRELTRGRLVFRIEGAGTVNGTGTVDIDWRNVVALRSTRPLDIELQSGERVTGTIDFAVPGKLEIATDTGGRSIGPAEIVRFQRHAANFHERISGDIELGFDFLTAGDEIDWTLNAAAKHRTTDYLTQASLSSLVRRHDSETTQQRNHLDIELRRLLRERWFITGVFIGEEDAELDLDLRLLLGAGGGRMLVQSSRTELAVYGGIDVSHEEFGGVSPDDGEIFEVFGSVQWDWFYLGGDVEVLVDTTVYVSPDDGRVRVELENSLRRRLTRNYFWSLNLYESYNSEPPVGLEKSDFGVSITVGRSF